MLKLLLALQAISSPIIDWQPFPMSRTPNGGLFDRTSAIRSRDVVKAWVRLVNVELAGVNKAREQTDLRMELDCRKPMVRIVSYRVVSPDGAISQARDGTAEQAKWRPAGLGTRSADVRSALCARVR